MKPAKSWARSATYSVSDRRSVDSYPASFFDGKTAVPRGGVVRILRGELCLECATGETLRWPVKAVQSVQRIAREIHLRLPAPLELPTHEIPEASERPECRIAVFAPEFENAIDDALRQFGDGVALGMQRAGRRMGIAVWALIAVFVVPLAYLAYSAALPRLHVLVPFDKERALGELVFERVEHIWPSIQHDAFDELASRIANELREPGSPFDLRISLVDAEDLNALALPGGRILVFRGLVEAVPSADALAGVLAHEIAHVEQRHGLKHMLRSAGLIQFAANAVGGGIDGLEFAETIVELSSGLLVLEHSRDHEREADRLGVAKLNEAGRSARGLAEFFELVSETYGDFPKDLGWLSTHPLSSDRIDAIKQTAALNIPTTPWMTVDEWTALQEQVAR